MRSDIGIRPFTAGLGLACCLLLAGPARASVTLDLIWTDTGTPTLTVIPDDPSAAAGGDICSTGFLSGAGVGRCLMVRITSAIAFGGALVSIGWDSTSGLALDADHALRPGYRSLGPLGAHGTTMSGAQPSLGPPLRVSLCQSVDPDCDTAFGALGGTAFPATPAGTYTIGSVNYSTSSITSSAQISQFIVPGDVADAKYNPVPVQISGATLNLVPEPAAAPLLGLGLTGLAALRRTRSRG